MKNILEVKDLTVKIDSIDKSFNVINDVNLSIEDNATLGVVGESGCGKTMTALSIMGLLAAQAKPVKGEIVFDGVDLLKKDKGYMRNIRGKDISIVFQEPATALNPVFTIGEQVSEAILAHKDLPKKEVKDILFDLFKRVKLNNPYFIYNSYPHSLSGGMKQRVMIAMAIALRPKLLILDEPTTALDVTVQAHILSLIEDLKRDFKMAIIFITHNLGIVARISDKIAVMYSGRVMELATKEEIFHNTKNPYTKGLLESIPPVGNPAKRLKAIKGEAPSMLAIPQGCPFHPRCPMAIDICKTIVPEYREIVKGHFSKCHLAEKV